MLCLGYLPHKIILEFPIWVALTSGLGIGLAQWLEHLPRDQELTASSHLVQFVV